MLALPISIVMSLGLAYLLARLLVARRIAMPIAALLLACIIQGFVNALAQYYGVRAFLFAQPVTACCIPPLAFLALKAAQDRGEVHAAQLVHLLAPAFVGFCIWTAREVIDAAVVAIFAGYGAAMLLVLRAGADALPEARLNAGDWPPLIWRAIAVILIVSALSDLAIALAMMAGAGWLKIWIVSFGSSGMLLLIGVLAATRSIAEPAAGADVGGVSQAAVADEEDAAASERDAAILDDIDRLLVGQKLYRDGDLTLSRLARRLGLPAKRVSEAINRQTGENVSRYVNGFRIRDACNALDAGQSVTEAMLGSGFVTKSNFNREFRRVTGRAPTAWADGGSPKALADGSRAVALKVRLSAAPAGAAPPQE